MGSTTAPQVSLKIMEALETAWDAIRAHHGDVPPVVVTLGAGSMERGNLRYGHFAAARWKVADEEAARSELFIGGEGLERGPEAVLATLLHEAAHGVASVRGIQDTSRQGRYHNTKFRALATELGLTVTKDPQIGWSPSTLADGTADRYRAALDGLGAVLIAHRHPELHGTAAGKKDTNTVTAALCACPRRIRVAPAVLAEGEILCAVCETAFTHPDDD
jgi:hypothetical protein